MAIKQLRKDISASIEHARHAFMRKLRTVKTEMRSLQATTYGFLRERKDRDRSTK